MRKLKKKRKAVQKWSKMMEIKIKDIRLSDIIFNSQTEHGTDYISEPSCNFEIKLNLKEFNAFVRAVKATPLPYPICKENLYDAMKSFLAQVLITIYKD